MKAFTHSSSLEGVPLAQVDIDQVVLQCQLLHACPFRLSNRILGTVMNVSMTACLNTSEWPVLVKEVETAVLVLKGTSPVMAPNEDQI